MSIYDCGMKNLTTEVVVVGGGPAGLTTAIALAGAGVETALVAGRTRAADNRTTALLAGSVTAFDTLGVWEHCRAHAAPLRIMRIVDATTRLIRAPEVRFDAREIGLDAFGHNIENRYLLVALDTRARALPALSLIENDAGAVTIDTDAVIVTLDNGDTITARLAIGAEGRRSLCRAAAGIEIDGSSYPQIALICTLSHTHEHNDISTEFHTESGPFTLVPLPGRRSSLVFVADPDEAPHLARLPDAAMGDEIERRSHSLLGKVTVESGRGMF